MLPILKHDPAMIGKDLLIVECFPLSLNFRPALRTPYLLP